MAKKVAKKAAKAAAPAKKKAKKVAPKKATKKKAVMSYELSEEEQAQQKPVKKGKESAAAKGKVKITVSNAAPEKTYQDIKDLIILIDDDIDKFLVNETRAAGRRIRGYAQQIRKKCATFRKEIQALANDRKHAAKGK